MAEVVCSHEGFKPTKMAEFDRIMMESGLVCLAFDTRREGVVMPPDYRPKQVEMGWLDLQKDSESQNHLVVDDWGVSVSLARRQERRFRAMVPWSAVYAVLDRQFQGWSWDNSMPSEVLHDQRDRGLTCQTCWPKVCA